MNNHYLTNADNIFTRDQEVRPEDTHTNYLNQGLTLL